MYRRRPAHVEITRRILIYTLMVLSVIAIVALLILIVSGYRYDAESGRVEQSAIIQFNSYPSGASVELDDRILSSRTQTKSNVFAGTHEVTMYLKGYETWQKTVNVRAGSIFWLDYVRFVPENRTTQNVATYSSVYGSLASPSGRYMLIQMKANEAKFDLVDLDGDTVKTESLSIPTDIYSEAETIDVSHSFEIKRWDENGRYILIRHTFGDKNEWLSLDSRNPSATKNISKLMGISISQAYYSGTSGNIVYVLSDGDIRKIDLSAATISRPLVSGVDGFSVYEDKDVIVYLGSYDSSHDNRTVGLYQEGYESPQILRTSQGNPTFRVATTHYYGDDYVAIAENNKVDILYGKYPSISGDNSDSLENFDTFELDYEIEYLSFSPEGNYLVAQAEAQLAGYNLEQTTLSKVALSSDSDNSSASLKWLDESHLWFDHGGVLRMCEFDGANTSTLTDSVVAGQSATLTRNERYIYSIGRSDDGSEYYLQRVRMLAS